GTVIYRSDISRRLWKFTSFGQMENLPYGELVAIQNRYPSYFTDGLLIVLDKAVQSEFGLSNMYENILTPDNIDTIFERPIDDLEIFVKNLPPGMKHTFVNKTQELYAENKLDSVKVIQLIEKQFGFSLTDNSPVEDIALKGDLGRNNIIYVDKK